MKKDQYKPAGKRATILLLKKILTTLPELLQDIAPDGFENSIYHQILYGDLEKDYIKYRTLRITQYKWSAFWSRKLVYTPKLSFADFKKTYKPSPPNLPAEILSLTAMVMVPIFSKYHVIYDEKGLDHGLVFQNYFNEYFLIAANRLSIFNNYRFKEEDLFDRYIYDKDIDLAPFYCFVFRKFKELQLRFYYEKSWPEFDSFIDCLEQTLLERQKTESMEEYNPEEALLKEMSIDQQTQELQYQRNLQTAAECMVPCEMVRAYVSVHGEYPDGYL